jgi:hypothetical protein
MAARPEVLARIPPRSDIANPRPDPAGVTAALAYVNRRLRGHRPFGILTGSSTGMAALMSRAASELGAREDLHLVHIAQPMEGVHAFLAASLGQLGFELGQAALDDLHNLFVVFLRHEAARGRRTVAIIEATEHSGPRVLEFLQTLSKVRAGATPAITFVLAGSRDLHRVLDSPGMSGLRPFTRERFDLDRALAWVTPGRAQPIKVPPAPAAVPASPGRLVVMLDGVIVERRPLAPGRLVIGRSRHAGLRLNSRYVSRQHAALAVAGEGVTVTDLGSTNSTLVNGQPVTSQQLEHGDLIAIGNFRVRYDCRPEADLSQS